MYEQYKKPVLPECRSWLRSAVWKTQGSRYQRKYIRSWKSQRSTLVTAKYSIWIYPKVIIIKGISQAKTFILRKALTSVCFLVGRTLCLMRRRPSKRRPAQRPALARTPLWKPVDPWKSLLSMMVWSVPPTAEAWTDMRPYQYLLS